MQMICYGGPFDNLCDDFGDLSAGDTVFLYSPRGDQVAYLVSKVTATFPRNNVKLTASVLVFAGESLTVDEFGRKFLEHLGLDFSRDPKAQEWEVSVQAPDPW